MTTLLRNSAFGLTDPALGFLSSHSLSGSFFTYFLEDKVLPGSVLRLLSSLYTLCLDNCIHVHGCNCYIHIYSQSPISIFILFPKLWTGISPGVVGQVMTTWTIWNICFKCRSLSSPYWIKVCMVEPGNQHSQQTSQTLFFLWMSFKHRTNDKPTQDNRASVTASWQVRQVFWGGSDCWRENGIRGWYWSWASEDAWELQTSPKSTHFPSSTELTP